MIAPRIRPQNPYYTAASNLTDYTPEKLTVRPGKLEYCLLCTAGRGTLDVEDVEDVADVEDVKDVEDRTWRT